MKVLFAAAFALAAGIAHAEAPTFKIACIDPLGGPFTNVGELMLSHLQYAVEDINAKGGVLKGGNGGVKLQLLQFDSKLSAQESQSALQSAIDQGVNLRYFNHSAGAVPGTVLAVAQAKIGRLTWVAEWHPGQQDAPRVEALAKAYKAKTGKDFLAPRIEMTPRFLAAAIDRARTTDARKIALAMEDLTFDSVVGPVLMRAEDHQLLLPQVVNAIAPVDGKAVKTGWEGTSYGFRTDAEYSGNELAQGTERRMVHP